MPARIQRKRTPGFRRPPDTVVVDRTSKRWGNPFRIVKTKLGILVIGPDDELIVEVESVEEGRKIAAGEFDRWIHEPEQAELLDTARRELAGKNLACYCPEPDEGEPDHCHGWIWLCIANPNDFCPKGIPADPGHQWTAGAWGPFTCWDCGAAKPVVKKRLLLETDLDDLHLDELFDHAGLHDRITITRLPADDTGPEAAGP